MEGMGTRNGDSQKFERNGDSQKFEKFGGVGWW
jgi:hypothetical protein